MVAASLDMDTHRDGPPPAADHNANGLGATTDPRTIPGLVVVIEERIGTLESLEPLAGGLVHQVTRVRGPRGSLILKQRLDHCAGLPHLPLNALDAEDEARAVSLLHACDASAWPRLHHYESDAHTLVLEDLAADGWKEGRGAVRSMTRHEVRRFIGRTASWLKELHCRLRAPGMPTAIRADGDEAFRARNTFERIQYHADLRALRLGHELHRRPRQLIVGDLQPKNMLIRDGAVRCFDAEHVHGGPPVFDLAFLVGHVILDRITCDGCAAAELVEVARAAYDPRDADLLQALVAATILYRAKNNIVPFRMVPALSDRHTLHVALLEVMGMGDERARPSLADALALATRDD